MRCFDVLHLYNIIQVTTVESVQIVCRYRCSALSALCFYIMIAHVEATLHVDLHVGPSFIGCKRPFSTPIQGGGFGRLIMIGVENEHF